MKNFFTRQTANDGIKLPLYYPNGDLSEHWLIVRGVDSDHFRRAETRAKRKVIEFAQIDNELEREEAASKAEIECLAELIADWSFEEEFNHDNVVKFLTEAPQIADIINKFAARRSEFFKKK